MTQAERGSLAEIEGSAECALGRIRNELGFVIRRTRHFMRLTEDLLQEAERVLAERTEEAEAHADDAARDAMAEKMNDAHDMLAEMRTDDDGPVDDRTPEQIAEDRGDQKYHELVDEGRADEVRPGGVR